MRPEKRVLYELEEIANRVDSDCLGCAELSRAIYRLLNRTCYAVAYEVDDFIRGLDHGSAGSDERRRLGRFLVDAYREAAGEDASPRKAVIYAESFYYGSKPFYEETFKHYRTQSDLLEYAGTSDPAEVAVNALLEIEGVYRGRKPVDYHDGINAIVNNALTKHFSEWAPSKPTSESIEQ